MLLLGSSTQHPLSPHSTTLTPIIHSRFIKIGRQIREEHRLLSTSWDCRKGSYTHSGKELRNLPSYTEQATEKHKGELKSWQLCEQSIVVENKRVKETCHWWVKWTQYNSRYWEKCLILVLRCRNYFIQYQVGKHFNSIWQEHRS